MKNRPTQATIRERMMENPSERTAVALWGKEYDDLFQEYKRIGRSLLSQASQSGCQALLMPLIELNERCVTLSVKLDSAMDHLKDEELLDAVANTELNVKQLCVGINNTIAKCCDASGEEFSPQKRIRDDPGYELSSLPGAKKTKRNVNNYIQSAGARTRVPLPDLRAPLSRDTTEPTSKRSSPIAIPQKHNTRCTDTPKRWECSPSPFHDPKEHPSNLRHLFSPHPVTRSAWKSINKDAMDTSLKPLYTTANTLVSNREAQNNHVHDTKSIAVSKGERENGYTSGSSVVSLSDFDASTASTPMTRNSSVNSLPPNQIESRLFPTKIKISRSLQQDMDRLDRLCNENPDPDDKSVRALLSLTDKVLRNIKTANSPDFDERKILTFAGHEEAAESAGKAITASEARLASLETAGNDVTGEKTALGEHQEALQTARRAQGRFFEQHGGTPCRAKYYKRLLDLKSTLELKKRFEPILQKQTGSDGSPKFEKSRRGGFWVI
jgi:hypothetical protein